MQQRKQDQVHVSDALRQDTWHMIFDLERQVRYCLTLADRYRKFHMAMRFWLLTGILGEAAIIYFSAGHPVLFWPLTAGGLLVLAGIAIFEADANFAGTAAELRTAARPIDHLKTQAESLWQDIESYRIEDQDARQKFEDIIQCWSQAIQHVNIPIHHQDNRKAAQEAQAVMAARYGSTL